MIGGCGLILARIRVCCEALLSSINAGAGAGAVGWLLFVVDSPSVRDEVDGADSVEAADTSFSIRKLVDASSTGTGIGGGSFFIRRRRK